MFTYYQLGIILFLRPQLVKILGLQGHYSCLVFKGWIQWGLEYQRRSEFQWLSSVRFSNDIKFWTIRQLFCPKTIGNPNCRDHYKTKPLKIHSSKRLVFQCVWYSNFQLLYGSDFGWHSASDPAVVAWRLSIGLTFSCWCCSYLGGFHSSSGMLSIPQSRKAFSNSHCRGPATGYDNCSEGWLSG